MPSGTHMEMPGTRQSPSISEDLDVCLAIRFEFSLVELSRMPSGTRIDMPGTG